MTQLQLAYLVAKTQRGQKEIVGKINNPKIVEYHQACSLQANNDEVAWCSSFVNWCYVIAGILMNPASMIYALEKHKYDKNDIVQFHKSAIEINKILKFQLPAVLEEKSSTNFMVKLGTRSAAARSWLGFGVKTTSPNPGDLVCYERGNDGWSGHIGFFESSAWTYVNTLGGNQMNQVCCAPYSKYKVLGYMTEE